MSCEIDAFFNVLCHFKILMKRTASIPESNIDLQKITFNTLFTNLFQSNQSIKALIYDFETLNYISVAMTQLEIIKQETILIEDIANRFRDDVKPYCVQMVCVVFVRPTEENVELIIQELKKDKPNFNNYALYFSNHVSDYDLTRIAKADVHEIVQSVQEVYVDYEALSKKLFSFNISDISSFRNNTGILSRSKPLAERLFSILATMKVMPIIKYYKKSNACKILADQLNKILDNNEIGFKSNETAQVLIIDRKYDFSIPLLHHTDFISFVHDLFTINHNKVKVPGEVDELYFDERNYPPTSEVLFMGIADATQKISDTFNEINQESKNLESKKIMKENMDEINKIFIEKQKIDQVVNYSTALLKISNNIYSTINSKYDSITNFLKLVQLENDILSSSKKDDLVNTIQNTNRDDAIRIAILNVVQHPSETMDCIEALERRGDVPDCQSLSKIQEIYLPYECSKLFSNKTKLQYILENNINSKKQDPAFEQLNSGTPNTNKVIVFFVGGITYDELNVINMFGKERNLDIIAGGNIIHNSSSFIENEIKPYIK